jgi:DMSO/TMAO reductase YedYZ molybdopterin-dependent catalytic subunit
VVRKSKGFSWGPAGLSTALFTGVVMRDVIERAKPLRKAKYVCMEGADKLVSTFTNRKHTHLTPSSQMGIMALLSSSTG